MLVASISTCHMLWYLHLAADAGIVVTAYTDDATATMVEDAERGGFFTEAILHPVVTIAGPGDILPAGGLAFDADGNLWTANSEMLLMYSRPGALSGQVDPAPARSLTVFNQASPSLNAHLIFSPPPMPKR